jgi:hypothetical protein
MTSLVGNPMTPVVPPTAQYLERMAPERTCPPVADDQYTEPPWKAVARPPETAELLATGYPRVPVAPPEDHQAGSISLLTAAAPVPADQ